METVVIPKKLAQEGDLMVVPRKEYEDFSKWRKAVKIRLDEPWFWTPEWQRKEAEADEAIRTGKVKGPFTDYKNLIRALKRK